MVAPEVRDPVLRKPSGEEAHRVPAAPSSPFPRPRALRAYLKALSLCPRGTSCISSVFFPFPGFD